MAKEIEAERPGAKCIAISADVRDIKSMESAVEQTITELGRIDFVIAGAAGNFLATIDVFYHFVSLIVEFKSECIQDSDGNRHHRRV